MGQPLGSFGEASIFSLSRGKTLPAAGGGLIGTNNETLTYKCQRILGCLASSRDQEGSFGIGSAFEAALMGLFIRPSLYWLPASLPFLKLGKSIYDPSFSIRPMSKFQEQLASRLLPGLDHLVAIRQRNAARLRRALSGLQGLYIIWPTIEGETSGCLRLPILLKDPVWRKRVLWELQQEGLGATGGCPAPLSDIPELRSKLAGPGSEFPVARQISQQLITLPTHPHVTESDIERMVEVFRRCLRKRL
jgi:dTDP-4-amino-4,6-dideoxygalactose transaminase